MKPKISSTYKQAKSKIFKKAFKIIAPFIVLTSMGYLFLGYLRKKPK